PVEATQLLRAALALWRGHPYADVPGCFVLELEARRLEELRLHAVETRIEAELALGGHSQLIAHALGGFGTYPAAWSPDGARLLSMAVDGTRIWDARTGRQLLKIPSLGGPGASAVWSPDGRQVLTESGSGPVVWDASRGKRLRTLETSAASGDMEFSRDGSRLANTTVDERAYAIRIW